MDEKKLLIIEDEPAIIRFLRASLEESAWHLTEALNARRGIELAFSVKPDAILLDLGLPDQDGLQVLKELRQWTSVPVIIISARGQEKDKVAALDLGADDYLIKPFGVDELKARLRVAMRHAQNRLKDSEPVYDYQGVKVDLVARRVWVKKKEIHLTPLQYDLLAMLVKNAGRLVRHQQIIDQVWGQNHNVTPESVRIFVHQLRHKIEKDPVRPRCIKTEPGLGYRLEIE